MVQLAPGQEYRVNVSAADPWNASGIELLAGGHYDFIVAAATDWRDDTIDADLATGWQKGGGLGQALLQPLACLRRSPDHPWYALLGAVRSALGELEYVLVGHGHSAWQPASNGRLYLFANDYPSAGRYANNHGSVMVTVKRRDQDQNSTATCNNHCS